ncbi:MAG TPA: protoporphyrinogen oxidase [Candidatus Eremiobacteraceae bacterium]|nr:protoporphyrinogen oxidase [Candidatus Eremiobacteraceae bacterium]
MNLDAEPLDIAIVGAGISGLTCAFECRAMGVRAAVFEAESEPGGCIRTIRRDGFVAEGGPQSLLASQPLTDLCRALGLTSKLVTASASAKKRYIATAQGLVALPMSPLALLSTPLLSMQAKWRLLREPAVPARTSTEDETVGAFVTRRTCREIVDAAVGPYVAGLCAGDPDEISVRAAFPVLEAMEREHGSVLRAARRRRSSAARPATVSFERGNAVLIESLAASLGDAMRTQSPVDCISRDDAGFTLSIGGPTPATVRSKKVVLAVPVAAAARLLDPIAPSSARAVSEIPGVPIAQVALAYPRAAIGVPLDGFGFLAMRLAPVRLLGAVWNSIVFPGRSGPDDVLVTAFLGGARDASILSSSDEAIAAIAHDDLGRVMQIAPTKPRVVAGFRWDAGIPQYTLGHDRRVQAIEDAAAHVPGLAVCGNFLHGLSVPDCIRQARSLALRMARSA